MKSKDFDPAANCPSPDLCRQLGGCVQASILDATRTSAELGQDTALERQMRDTICDHPSLRAALMRALTFLIRAR